MVGFKNAFVAVNDGDLKECSDHTVITIVLDGKVQAEQTGSL